MVNKKIVFSIPEEWSNVRIVKEIRLDDTHAIHMEISEDVSGSETLHNDSVYFCYQQKQKIAFNPFEYAYIESTSNHYSRWHPINADKPVLSIYSQSFGELHSKLHTAGLQCFWRVHSSFIVNSKCIMSFVNDKITLKAQPKSIPIGREYKEDFLSKINII